MSDARWRCAECGVLHPLTEPRYVCDCPAAGRLDYVPSRGLAAASRDELLKGQQLWRYSAVLPISADDQAARSVADWFPVGNTPLCRAHRLADQLGVGELWIKNEAANPSGSLKDRASAMVLAAALKSHARVVAAASSGNAAASMAAACAASGLPFVAFVPGRIPSGRCADLVRYGAKVLLVDGDYDDAIRLSLAACDEWGWFCRTSAVNPFTTQGKKTVALEVAEQLGWAVPDVVVVPAGDGNILTSLHHGFRDAYELGWTDRIPRLVAVQSASAAAIARAWAEDGKKVLPAPATTVAAGINVSRPLDGTRALAALRDSRGMAVTVPDDAILAACDMLATTTGVTAEASSAAAVAALPDLVAIGAIDSTSRVVVINTGAGGHSTGGLAGTMRIPADLSAVREAVGPLAAGNRVRTQATTLSNAFGT